MEVDGRFPYYAQGSVVKGFGRGSKDMGIPTANFPDEVVDQLPAAFDQGVYYGWASLDGGPIYKMVMSVGTNPFWNNERKTMETHILQKFDSDFYGKSLAVCVSGFIRDNVSFESLDQLVKTIHTDIATATVVLDSEKQKTFHDSFRKWIDQ